jgi:hypothetical protein
VTGKPVDEVAERVTRPGTHFDSKPLTNTYTIYDEKPWTRQPNATEKANRNFKSLAGRRVGRFVVIGISVDVPKRWVVRCDCGKYELRTAKYLKNPGDISKAKCQHCAYLVAINGRYRRYEKWIAAGAPKSEEEGKNE